MSVSVAESLELEPPIALMPVIEPALDVVPPLEDRISKQFEQSWRSLQYEVEQIASNRQLSPADSQQMVGIFQTANAARLAYGDEQPPAALNNICDRVIGRLIEAQNGTVRLIINGLPQKIDADEIRSEAGIAITEAALKFDPTRGISFETFVGTKIRQRVVDFTREFGVVRIPRSVQRTHKQIVRSAIDPSTVRLVKDKSAEQLAAEAEMPNADIESWTEAQLADRLNVTVNAWRRYMAGRSLINITSPQVIFGAILARREAMGIPGRSDSASDDMVMDVTGERLSPEELLQLIDRVITDNTMPIDPSAPFYAGHWLTDKKELRKLRISERDAAVARRYYGLGGNDFERLLDISADFGLTESRVSQIRGEVCSRVQQILTSMPGYEDFARQLLI